MVPASRFIFRSHTNCRPAPHRAFVLADPASDTAVRVYKRLLQLDMHIGRGFLPESCYSRVACQIQPTGLMAGLAAGDP